MNRQPYGLTLQLLKPMFRRTRAMTAGMAMCVLLGSASLCAAQSGRAGSPLTALATGDMVFTRQFSVRVDTTLGMAFSQGDARSRPVEVRVDTLLGVPFALRDVHGRPVETRVDTLLGVPIAVREANSRQVELRHAQAYAPWAYRQAHSRSFHAFGQLLPAAVEDAPIAFAFHPPAPNPAHSGAVLRFDLPAQARVSVDLLDVMGRRVKTLADRTPFAAGRWAIPLTRGRLPSGLYFVRLQAGAVIATRRLVFVE